MAVIKPLADAVAAIDAKTPIGSVLRSADWETVPTALRQRAQFSAGVESARVLQTIQDRLAGQIRLQRENLANGKTATFDRNSFINAVRDIARDEGLGLGTQDPGRGTVRDITSIPRLGLIHDMQIAQATGFARHKLDTSEGALLLYPAWRLGESTADEPRPLIWWERRWAQAGAAVGWSGAVQVEFVALKTSPIWSALSRFGTPWPPFDWGSTRELEDVGRDEAISLGLLEESEVLNRGGAGGENFNAELQASATGLSPQMIAQLRGWFGQAVEFVGNTVKWALG